MRKNLQVKHVSRACTMTPTAFFLAKFWVFHLILDLITAVNSNNSLWIASFTMCCLSGVSQWMVDVCRTVSLDMQYILAVTLPQEKKKIEEKNTISRKDAMCESKVNQNTRQ